MTQQKQVVAISITGSPGAGKSAVVNMIANILEQRGFEVQLLGQVTVRAPELLDAVIQRLAPITRVQITESKPRRSTDDGKG